MSLGGPNGSQPVYKVTFLEEIYKCKNANVRIYHKLDSNAGLLPDSLSFCDPLQGGPDLTCTQVLTHFQSCPYNSLSGGKILVSRVTLGFALWRTHRPRWFLCPSLDQESSTGLVPIIWCTCLCWHQGPSCQVCYYENVSVIKPLKIISFHFNI